MSRYILTLFFIFILGTNAFAKTGCDPTDSDAQGWSKTEKIYMGSVEAREVFSRPSFCELKINLRNGKTKSYKSYFDEKQSDDPVSFYLSDYYMEQNYALISYRWMNGEVTEFILVNLQNGAETLLNVPPDWSPDKKLFATAIDLDNQSEENGAKIFSCADQSNADQSKSCKELFSLASYRGMQAYWLSSTEVVFSLKKGYEKNMGKSEEEYRLHVICNQKSCKAKEKPQLIE